MDGFTPEEALRALPQHLDEEVEEEESFVWQYRSQKQQHARASDGHCVLASFPSLHLLVLRRARTSYPFPCTTTVCCANRRPHHAPGRSLKGRESVGTHLQRAGCTPMRSASALAAVMATGTGKEGRLPRRATTVAPGGNEERRRKRARERKEGAERRRRRRRRRRANPHHADAGYKVVKRGNCAAEGTTE